MGGWNRRRGSVSVYFQILIIGANLRIVIFLAQIFFKVKIRTKLFIFTKINALWLFKKWQSLGRRENEPLSSSVAIFPVVSIEAARLFKGYNFTSYTLEPSRNRQMGSFVAYIFAYVVFKGKESNCRAVIGIGRSCSQALVWLRLQGTVHLGCCIKSDIVGSSLVASWLGLCVFTAIAQVQPLIGNILYTVCLGKKKKKLTLFSAVCSCLKMKYSLGAIILERKGMTKMWKGDIYEVWPTLKLIVSELIYTKSSFLQGDIVGWGPLFVYSHLLFLNSKITHFHQASCEERRRIFWCDINLLLRSFLGCF